MTGNKAWIVFGFGMLLLAVTIVFHETTHGVIAYEYGCTNIHYTMGWSGFYTNYDCLPEQALEVRQAQAYNEIVGYNIVPLLTLVLVMLFYLCLRR